jgi:hypothetical protein
MTDAASKPIEEQFKKLEEDSANQQKIIGEETKKGKELDGLKLELEPVKKRKEESVKKYATKRRDLEREWDCQKTEIVKLRAEIIAKFPDYVAKINDKICGVLGKITTQQGKITALEAQKGSKEKTAEDARLAAAASKTKLDAWFDADQKIAGRLSEIENRMKELRVVMAGPDDVYGIYLFWFKILPLHQEIAPRHHAPPAPDAQLYADPDPRPVEKPECLPVPDLNAVYLISVAGYGPKLDDAWANYQAARKALSTAEADFKEHPDDLSAETKNLKKMIDTQDDDVKKALKD